MESPGGGGVPGGREHGRKQEGWKAWGGQEEGVLDGVLDGVGGQDHGRQTAVSSWGEERS